MVNLFYTFLIVSNFLVFGTPTGGISPYSPGIPISLFLTALVLIGYSFKNKFSYSKRFLRQIILSLSLMLISVFLALYHGESIFVYLGKTTYLISTLFSSLLVTNKNARLIINSVLCIFTIDLIYRLFSISSNFYSFKVSLIFVDTNFIGVTIIPCLVLLLIKKFNHKITLLYLIVFISTISRTAYFGIFPFIVSNLKSKIKYLFITPFIISILIFINNPEMFLGIEASLDTKILIAKSSYLFFSDLNNVLLGLGKMGVEEIMGKGITVGHTLIGIVLQYGLIYLVMQIICTILFIGKEYRLTFLGFWCFIGIFALYPLSSLGLSLILFNAAYHLTNTEKIQSNSKIK